MLEFLQCDTSKSSVISFVVVLVFTISCRLAGLLLNRSDNIQISHVLKAYNKTAHHGSYHGKGTHYPGWELKQSPSKLIYHCFYGLVYS